MPHRYSVVPKLFGGKVDRFALAETLVLVACRGGLHDEEVCMFKSFVERFGLGEVTIDVIAVVCSLCVCVTRNFVSLPDIYRCPLSRLGFRTLVVCLSLPKPIESDSVCLQPNKKVTVRHVDSHGPLLVQDNGAHICFSSIEAGRFNRRRV